MSIDCAPIAAHCVDDCYCDAILAAASRRQSRAEGVASRQQSALLVILTVRSANMWLRYPRVTQYVNPMQ